MSRNGRAAIRRSILTRNKNHFVFKEATLESLLKHNRKITYIVEVQEGLKILDLLALTLERPTRHKPVLDPLAVHHLGNRLYMLSNWGVS